MAIEGVLIVNPKAGQGRLLDELQEMLGEQSGLEILQTRRPGEARELASRAVRQGVPLVVAAGGDGTVSEVINGMAVDFSRSRLGILPLGSANDFCKTVGIPEELRQAVSVLESSDVRRVDVVEVRGGSIEGGRRISVNAATGGFSREVADRLEDEDKARWKGLAYLRGAVRAIPHAAVYDVRLKLDGQWLQTRAMAVLLANGRWAGGIRLTSEASPADAKMDVALVTAESLRERASVLGSVLGGSLLESEHVWFFRAGEIELTSEPPMRFNIDGEPAGQTPVALRVLPGVLQVLAPRVAER